MVISETLFNELREEEAMALLSSLGFSRGDWPVFAKLGGAKAILASELLQSLPIMRQLLPRALVDLRKNFDRFYDDKGFLVTPREHAHARLFRNASAPLCFFAQFNATLLDDNPIVAIVGARDASAHGLECTNRLARELALHNVTVLSGGARGIDQAAHESALAAGGATIVMSGVAFNFAKESALVRALRAHRERLAVVYPFGPFRAQEKYMFVERNRYVASLADVVVVVEGKAGSGTLYTARFAEDLSVPLYCVNPSDESALAFVPSELILAGRARVLSNFEQFAEALVTKRSKPPKKRKLSVIDHTEKPKKAGSLPYLLQIINDHENSIGFDELLLETGLSFAQLQKELLSYELDGRIFKRGSQFVLTGN